jgi:hypothetical protein
MKNASMTIVYAVRPVTGRVDLNVAESRQSAAETLTS